MLNPGIIVDYGATVLHTFKRACVGIIFIQVSEVN